MAFPVITRRAFGHRTGRNVFSLLLKRYESANLELPSSASSPSASLLSLLRRRAGDRKDGLGYGVGDLTIPAARAALMEAISPGESHAPEAVADSVCTHYSTVRASDEGRKAFFSVLAGDLGVDHREIVSGAQNLLDLHSQGRVEATLLKSEGHLRGSLRPFYCDLFSLISRLEGGIKFLVDLRGDLLDVIQGQPDHLVYGLAEMNAHLRTILAQWFSVGLLDLRQVTWESPCDILEKVSQYEAVHPLRHWRDLKHRVGPNRRCFIFTHRAFPREPIVVLHTALTREPAASVQVLLDRTLHGSTDGITTAVFYSISATQKGLSGIELGNFLIRKVVQELQREFPNKLKTFVTLSPIPGFRRWLDSHLKLHAQNGMEGCQIRREEMEDVLVQGSGEDGPIQALQVGLRRLSLEPKSPQNQTMRTPLTQLCARYLTREKRRGRALDPVAHFHFTNGASVWRVNWMGDVSPTGLQRSYGLMANYRYHLPDMDSNSTAYTVDGQVTLSDTVDRLVV